MHNMHDLSFNSHGRQALGIKMSIYWFSLFGLGFPGDGTSRDKPGRDVPLSLCPGTKKFHCPVVPLSWDKKVLPVPVSLCPGTRSGANVPGQTPLSRDVPGQNELKNFK